MFCHECGEQLEGTAKFCTKCGAKLPETMRIKEERLVKVKSAEDIKQIERDEKILAYNETQNVQNSLTYNMMDITKCTYCSKNKDERCTYYGINIKESQKYNCGFEKYQSPTETIYTTQPELGVSNQNWLYSVKCKKCNMNQNERCTYYGISTAEALNYNCGF